MSQTTFIFFCLVVITCSFGVGFAVGKMSRLWSVGEIDEFVEMIRRRRVEDGVRRKEDS